MSFKVQLFIYRERFKIKNNILMLVQLTSQRSSTIRWATNLLTGPVVSDKKTIIGSKRRRRRKFEVKERKFEVKKV